MEKAYCADIPFFKAMAQADKLAGNGVKPTNIYIEGRGAETIETCANSFRGEPGILSIWGTLRVLGATREAIVSQIKELHARKIVVLDREVQLRSDKDGAVMLDAALKKIQGSAKVRNDRKFAREIGAKGGRGKLESMRAQRMPEATARAIWQCEKLTAKERLALINSPDFPLKWTEATAYRHLGKK